MQQTMMMYLNSELEVVIQSGAPHNMGPNLHTKIVEKKSKTEDAHSRKDGKRGGTGYTLFSVHMMFLLKLEFRA